MSLRWNPPIETSPAEDKILAHCKKAKLFVFLRQQRHRLLDEDFQRRLAATYPARTAGKEPVSPAMLAMVTLLQAAMDVSDEDAVEFAVMDRRWQMLLDTLGSDECPFSQGTLYNFRERLMAHDLDEVLLDRTVALAKETRGFSFKALRTAFDASPLFGAGRVEDTFNLIGHAARELLRAAAKRLGLDEDTAAEQAGIPLVTGSSLKASLDVDWDDPKQKKVALETLLSQVRSLTAFVERELAAELATPPLAERWATLKQVLAQDLEPDPDGGGQRIKRGVAKERRISVRDSEMRHGRKSKTSRVDGFKRHLAVDVDSTLIVGVAITPANRPEAEAAHDLLDDVRRHAGDPAEIFIDRGYLSADEIAEQRARGTTVHCKAFPLRNNGRFTKGDFVLDLDARRITCPAGITVEAEPGATVHFPTETCRKCAKRESCTTAAGRGRSVTIHSREEFFVELRTKQRTAEGRAANRLRVVVEHCLAAISRTQHRRARYLGVRKNLFDLRRHAAVANLHVVARAA